jgi:tellurite resistance protein TehA-like permease
MATGILSTSAYLLERKSLAMVLFQINKAAYGILWILTIIRFFLFPKRVAADLIDHGRGSGFFSIVAGTCVLGSQFVLFERNLTIGALLWFLGVLLWFILIYTFISAVTISDPKPSLAEGLNGGWLLAVVATQAISIMSTQLAPFFTDWKETLLLFSLVMYLLGGMLYLLIISLIFYRFVFFSLMPKEFTPTYWINMGAAAISTLAGATLILNGSDWVFLQEILSFLKGSTLLFWGMSSWWIPLLFILSIWRYVCKKFSLQYDPQYWGMVFPLGMYTACSHQLMEATGISFLSPIPHYFFYIALLVWAVIFAELIHWLWEILHIPKKNRELERY